MSKKLNKNININSNKEKYLADVWIVDNNKYLFPEIQSKLYNPNGVGISVSGGGSRSYVSMIGYMRALNKLIVQDKKVFNKTQFISSISGGSWFVGVYLLANKSIEEQVLLGNSYDFNALSTCTFKDLEKLNHNNHNYYMGKRVTNADILKHVFDGFLEGYSHSELWNYSIGKIFLSTYDCFEKPICLNESDALKIYDITKIKPVIIRPNSPFWIIDTTLIYDTHDNLKGLNTIQFTPYYSGIPNVLKTNNYLKYIGGFWQSTYSFDSDYPDNLDVEDEDSVQEVSLNKRNGCFTAEKIIGTSSNAYGDYFHKAKEEHNYTELSGLISKYNLWTPMIPYHSDEFYLVDGCVLNNTSILSLIQRKVSKIISFNSVSKVIDKSNIYNETWDCTNLPNLFKESNLIQIFESKSWENVANNLITNSNKGLPMYSVNKLKVLSNPNLYIEGNYEVEILFIILQPSKIFNDLLSDEIKNIITNKKDLLPYFPNYPTVGANPGKFIELTNAQVNLLSTYTDWSISQTEIKDIILDFYK